jgi:co-chaperonin GroES (HSP10)
VTLRLRNDNILVRMHSDERASKGGIILPATRSKHPNQAVLATVVAAGPGYYPEVKALPQRVEKHGLQRVERVGRLEFIPTEVEPGDVVVVDSPHCGDNFGEPEERLRIVRQAEILCVVDGIEAGEAV